MEFAGIGQWLEKQEFVGVVSLALVEVVQQLGPPVAESRFEGVWRATLTPLSSQQGLV